MYTSSLDKWFSAMGARIKLEDRHQGFSIDILQDQKGEYFSLELANQDDLELVVIDLQPPERHLLLMIREFDGRENLKHKFLCGHDERHWFVAAVPNQNGVKDVSSAMEALKPDVVRQQQIRQGLKGRQLKRRKNKAYIRQGEWFFIPVGIFNPAKSLILKNEPIRRGSGKPHMCEFLYRSAGETVYVNSEFPNGITEAEYNVLCNRNFKYRKQNWRVMARNAEVYVKGKVWHPDHATIVLKEWHQVEMNLEFQAPSMSNLAFLD